MSPSFPPLGAAVPNVILGTLTVAVLSVIVSVPSVTTKVETIPVAELSLSRILRPRGIKKLVISYRPCVRTSFRSRR